MGLSDYKIVEYIKNVSPYQQIILTDIVPLSTDRIDVRMKFGVDSSGTDNQPLFGACEIVSGSWKARYCSYFTCSNRSIAFYNHFTWHTDISANYILNASETGNSSTNAQQTLSMGLTQGSWGSQVADYSSEYNSSFSDLSIPIAFFGVNWSGELRPTINKEIYIYGASIFNSNNECIHSLLPVERISDSALGLYDTITDKFYSNSGSGSLAKGGYTGVWLIDEGGDITNTNFIDLPSAAMATPYPHALWRIEEGYNDGIPYNMLMADVPAFGAFANATSLAVIRIPQSVKSIGAETFRNTNLTSVTIASDCTYYDTSFPEGCVVNFYPD